MARNGGAGEKTRDADTTGKGASASTDSAPPAKAKPEVVQAAVERLKALGPRARYVLQPGQRLTEIVIQDGSNLTADDIGLFGQLLDLEKLQIFNCRSLDDEMAARLSGLQGLTSLALTNSVINDPTVALIVQSFPQLVELDLSSNTNMTNGVMKTISELKKLQRLTLVQNQFNDLGARRLSQLTGLRTLDLRGNMEAGDMALEVIADLPQLSGFKHRSTAVTDAGLEHLSRSQQLDSLLMQDFVITDQSGPHLAKLAKLTQLEVFRCQGFGTEGVLALKGMGLVRLTLRDLPNVDDRALEVLDDLPKLRRLYLHELSSISDAGLKHLGSAQTLEVLDIWSVPQLTDATIDVIAGLPNLKELSLRSTGITDAAVDKLLALSKLQSLTCKDNGSLTPDGLKRLSGRKWGKLDIGTSEPDAGAAP
ncbi:MAG: hypothetical protein U0935_14405 [Pirellulales bacterium]